LGEPWCLGLLQDVPKETAPNGDYPSWQAKNWMTVIARIYCIGHVSCDVKDEGWVQELEYWSPRFWYFTTLDATVKCDWLFKNPFFCNFCFLNKRVCASFSFLLSFKFGLSQTWVYCTFPFHILGSSLKKFLAVMEPWLLSLCRLQPA